MENVELLNVWIDKKDLLSIKESLTMNKVDELEKYFCMYFQYACCINSYIGCFHLALLSLEFDELSRKRTEVIIPDYCSFKIVKLIESIGFKPVFVDVDEKTYNIDYKDLKRKVDKKRTKAIIVSHRYGQSADMAKILKLSDKRNVPIIEDCSNSIGSTFKGFKIGMGGLISIFSLRSGGVIATNKLDIYNFLNTCLCVSGYELIADDAHYPYYFLYEKLSNLEAAFELSQLEKLQKVIKKRNSLARYWNKKLKEVDFIQAPYRRKGRGNTHTYESYVCLTTPVVRRGRLIQTLRKKGIWCDDGGVYSQTGCSNAEDITNRTIRFPLYYKMKKEEIDKIVEILKEVREEVFI